MKSFLMKLNHVSTFSGQGQRVLHRFRADYPGADYSQLYALLLKISSMRQHRKDDSHKLMCCCKYCLLKWLSLISFLEKVFSEHGIMIDDSNCHNPDHSPEMTIPSLRYLACSFIFA